MKKIRRTRITVRKREITIIKNGASQIHPEETGIEICPLCNSPLHSKLQLRPVCNGNLLTKNENLLIDEN